MSGTEYHKIHAPFKRHTSGPDKGKLIYGDWALPEFKYLAGNEWEFTEKVDGTNIRIEITRKDTGLFINHWGRTDAAQIPAHLSEVLDDIFPPFGQHGSKWANSDKVEARSRRLDDIWNWMQNNDLDHAVLYGEGYGPKIQGGGKYRDDVSFVLFDVKIGDFWLDRGNVNDIASKLGIDSVPVLGKGTLWDAMDIVKGYEELGSLGKTIVEPLKSQWGDFEAEGIVARPTVPLFNRKGERIITKIKAVDFR